jgi:hypothetical protein
MKRTLLFVMLLVTAAAQAAPVKVTLVRWPYT